MLDLHLQKVTKIISNLSWVGIVLLPTLNICVTVVLSFVVPIRFRIVFHVFRISYLYYQYICIIVNFSHALKLIVTVSKFYIFDV